MSWKYDSGRKVWICSRFLDLDGNVMDNLAEHGQPFAPGQEGFVEDDSLDIDFSRITVEVSQAEVMTNGYGRNVVATDFPIVNRFLRAIAPTRIPPAGSIHPSDMIGAGSQHWEHFPLPHGSYPFDSLVSAGFAVKSDRWISSINLYNPVSCILGAHAISGEVLEDCAEQAYVHGSVTFALMAGTRFISSPGTRRVEAEIGAGQDNWDFTSDTIPDWINITIGTVLGPTHFNLEKPIKIQFTGSGKRSVAEKKF